MNKRWIIGITAGVVLLALIGVAVLAAGVGGEASKMDAMMKDDVTQHKPFADIKKQLADAGYSIQQESPKLIAVGPKHSLIVYTTWLTIQLGFDQAGLCNSYHMDRAS